jgi:hypothetical protein
MAENPPLATDHQSFAPDEATICDVETQLTVCAQARVAAREGAEDRIATNFPTYIPESDSFRYKIAKVIHDNRAELQGIIDKNRNFHCLEASQNPVIIFIARKLFNTNYTLQNLQAIWDKLYPRGQCTYSDVNEMIIALYDSAYSKTRLFDEADRTTVEREGIIDPDQKRTYQNLQEALEKAVEKMYNELSVLSTQALIAQRYFEVAPSDDIPVPHQIQPFTSTRFGAENVVKKYNEKTQFAIPAAAIAAFPVLTPLILHVLGSPNICNGGAFLAAALITFLFLGDVLEERYNNNQYVIIRKYFNHPLSKMSKDYYKLCSAISPYFEGTDFKKSDIDADTKIANEKVIILLQLVLRYIKGEKTPDPSLGLSIEEFFGEQLKKSLLSERVPTPIPLIPRPTRRQKIAALIAIAVGCVIGEYCAQQSNTDDDQQEIPAATTSFPSAPESKPTPNPESSPMTKQKATGLLKSWYKRNSDGHNVVTEAQKRQVIDFLFENYIKKEKGNISPENVRVVSRSGDTAMGENGVVGCEISETEIAFVNLQTGAVTISKKENQNRRYPRYPGYPF